MGASFVGWSIGLFFRLCRAGEPRKIQTLQLPLQLNNGLNPSICEICARHGIQVVRAVTCVLALSEGLDFPGAQLVWASWRLTGHQSADRAGLPYGPDTMQ